jgi:hypothetical protein
MPVLWVRLADGRYLMAGGAENLGVAPRVLGC